MDASTGSVRDVGITFSLALLCMPSWSSSVWRAILYFTLREEPD
jgi:hypothetical protein